MEKDYRETRLAWETHASGPCAKGECPDPCSERKRLFDAYMKALGTMWEQDRIDREGPSDGE